MSHLVNYLQEKEALEQEVVYQLEEERLEEVLKQDDNISIMPQFIALSKFKAKHSDN